MRSFFGRRKTAARCTSAMASQFGPISLSWYSPIPDILCSRGIELMKIISLNVGLPRLVEYNGEPVATGIFKEPVSEPLMLRTLNLDGDRQADLSVHGGVYKAVYGYPSEHYEFWKTELPGTDL